MLRFYVLGPLELQVDGDRGTLRGAKLRKVCALLLLRAGETVDIRSFVTELWDSESPAVAASTLRTHVYYLRRALGSAADRLETTPGGYRLHVEPHELDARLFARLVDEGTQRLEDGSADSAAQILREALALWRGRVLADLPTGPSLTQHVIQLDELRARALESRIEADLRVGRHRMVIPELRSLVTVEPLNEWAYARLMEALRHAGRRDEALAAFRRARRNLDEELGVAPAPELQRLHHEILGEGMPA